MQVLLAGLNRQPKHNDILSCITFSGSVFNRDGAQDWTKSLQENNMREVWTGMKEITGCGGRRRPTPGSRERANKLNCYFNRFSSQPSPASSTTPPTPHTPSLPPPPLSCSHTSPLTSLWSAHSPHNYSTSHLPPQALQAPLLLFIHTLPDEETAGEASPAPGS